MNHTIDSEEHLVSIVVIFFNEERFLQNAIDSVQAQTCPHWELLLVNDGSTDGSSEIAQRNAARDPHRIRYLTHDGGQNRGKSTSRNLGLRAARGEFISFLDGDDVFRPEKVARQASLLASRTAAAMVYGPTLYWSQWPGAPSDAPTDRMGELEVTPGRVYQPPLLLRIFLKKVTAIPCICGLIVRRSIALLVNGFDERIQNLYEDQVFLAKVCVQFPVMVDSNCYDQYRQHPDSTSQIAIASGAYNPVGPNPSQLTYFNWLGDYLHQQGVGDAQLLRALKNAQFPYRHPGLHRSLHRMRSLPHRLVNSILRKFGRIESPAQPERRAQS